LRAGRGVVKGWSKRRTASDPKRQPPVTARHACAASACQGAARVRRRRPPEETTQREEEEREGRSSRAGRAPLRSDSNAREVSRYPLGDQEGARRADGLGEAGESKTERKREREEGRRRETVGEGGPRLRGAEPARAETVRL